MNLPQSDSLVPRLVWLDESASTNTDLVAAASGADAAAWPDFGVLVTDTQTSGRGRLGRSWVAPAKTSLAISVLVRPGLPVETLAWLPLIAGVAMARAANALLPEPKASVKWPNDVLIGRAKLSGILSELLPGGAGVVVGAGVNLFLTDEQLPVPTATSLALAGAADFSVDDVLAAYLAAFRELYSTFVQHGGDAEASGIAATVAAECSTIGQPVGVELPGGEVVTGLATGLDAGGRLLVTRDADASSFAVSAGDVTHLRY
ncbi:biotin--[acetyl-CoA-carboxylase] ligase [Subtercola sp. YIM 133946]|uniref:biotin--[acetyl-CoA-carboxylase] ligase n=1 Tax=Subtercola sp. YIM 133946 TaxID=3118909 RepID=UPI002F92C3E8